MEASTLEREFFESAKMLSTASQLTIADGALPGRLIATDLPLRASTAREAMKGYLDHMGVTSRYANYRNNASRARASHTPTETAATYKRRPGATAGMLEMNGEETGAADVESITRQRLIDVREQAGINTVFPGQSEYMTVYGRSLDDGKRTFLPINPLPDEHIYGRPTAEAPLPSWLTITTTSHTWPTCSSTGILPWKRE